MPNGSSRARILDFGLARDITEDVSITGENTILGTPAYMAPEQARSKPVDHRADLFSLGVILYQMVTGQRPFSGENSQAILLNLALETPESPKKLRPETPTLLSDLILRLLEKEPENRPDSPAEVMETLQRIEQQLGSSTPPRKPLRTLLVAGGLFALVAALFAGVVIIIRDSQGKKIAEYEIPKGGRIEIRDVPTKNQANVRPVKTWQGTPEQEQWIARVAKLEPEKQVEAVAAKLKEMNPGIQIEKLSKGIKEGQVVSFRMSTQKVRHIWPVRAFRKLESLHAGGYPGRGHLKDLSPLIGMPITELSCGSNPVTDFSPLKNLPLHKLSITRCKLSDLTPLRNLELHSLDVTTTNVSDLSPLRGMPLQELACGYSPVSDLSPLKGIPLRLLRCGRTQVKDLSPLQGLPLEILDLGGTNVVDLSPLRGMKLKVLCISSTQVTDLSPLRGMKLEQLTVSNSNVADISPLRNLPLISLHATEVPVSDWTPLSDIPLKGFNRSISFKRLTCTFPLYDEQTITVLKKHKGNLVSPTIWAALSDRIKDNARWEQETLKLNFPQRVEAIHKRHQSLNAAASFKAKYSLKLETIKGQVTTAEVVVGGPAGTRTTDLSALRVLPGLKTLRLLKNTDPLIDLSPVQDLPIEELFCPKSAVLRNRLILGRMKTLKTINGEPAQTYIDRVWNEAKARPVKTWQGTPEQEQWIARVAKLEPKKQVEAVTAKLKEINPGSLSRMSHQIKDGRVVVFFMKTENVRHIWPLRAFTKLERLDAYAAPGKGHLKDLSALKGMPIKVLNVQSNRNIRDLSPLSHSPLEELNCTGASISDLSPLQHLPLTKLNCDSTSVSDLTPIAKLKLNELIINRTKVVDLSLLRGMPLQELDCRQCSVSDLSPLKDLPLRVLKCSN